MPWMFAWMIYGPWDFSFSFFEFFWSFVYLGLFLALKILPGCHKFCSILTSNKNAEPSSKNAKLQMHSICIGHKKKTERARKRVRDGGRGIRQHWNFCFDLLLICISNPRMVSVFYGSREIKTDLTSVSAFGRFIDTVIYGSSFHRSLLHIHHYDY